MIRILILMLVLFGCQHPTPKPNAALALVYPNPTYQTFDATPCTYQFMHNKAAIPKLLSACGTTVHYPALKAKLYITYFNLNEASMDTLLMDFEKRLKVFGNGTQQLKESAYEDPQNGVIGSCVTLIGDSPSNLHFFGTDTKRHFISGSLLFEAAPNYDSLAPAISYIKNDVQKMLETLRWD